MMYKIKDLLFSMHLVSGIKDCSVAVRLEDCVFGTILEDAATSEESLSDAIEKVISRMLDIRMEVRTCVLMPTYDKLFRLTIFPVRNAGQRISGYAEDVCLETAFAFALVDLINKVLEKEGMLEEATTASL